MQTDVPTTAGNARQAYTINLGVHREMYSVELYARARRTRHVEAMSSRVAAQYFGIDRSLRGYETVRGTVSPENDFADFEMLGATRVHKCHFHIKCEKQ